MVDPGQSSLYFGAQFQKYAVLLAGVFIGISLKWFEAIQDDWKFVDVTARKKMRRRPNNKRNVEPLPNCGGGILKCYCWVRQ